MVALFSRIFIVAFYRQYSGLFLIIGLAFVGLCPPGEHWRVFVNLALATVTYRPALGIFLVLLLAYQYLVIHYVHLTLNKESFRFLKFSIHSFSFPQRLIGWSTSITMMSFPMLLFTTTAIFMGFWKGDTVFATVLLIASLGVFYLSHHVAFRFADPLRKTNSSVLWTVWGAKLGADYLTLGIRFLLSKQRIPYLMAKLLSYTFVNMLFLSTAMCRIIAD